MLNTAIRYISLESASNDINALNELSQQKYDDLVKKFEANTKCFKEMKVDLEYIFKKIRYLTAEISWPSICIYEDVRPIEPESKKKQKRGHEHAGSKCIYSPESPD